MRSRTAAWLFAAAFAILALASCRAIVRGSLVPDAAFQRTSPPEAPDYGDASSWAALPDRADEADVTPVGATDGQDGAAADVFFLHPTTYFSGDRWNQPLDDEETNRRTDQQVLRNQASAFNAAGRVYAPRYRQATLGAFLTDDRASADAARALAYADVRRAFRSYLERWGGDRPLVLASHSQGSRMMLRLLSEFFAEDGEHASETLRRRLVAAYVIGAPVPRSALDETFPGVPLCRSARQTGCLVTYNSVEAGARPDRLERPRIWFPDGPREVEGTDLLCVHPVSWEADGGWSDRDAHRGTVRFGDEKRTPRPRPDLLRARCRDGLLEVELSEDVGPNLMGEDYHLVDYSLFYMDLRENAVRRVLAFLQR